MIRFLYTKIVFFYSLGRVEADGVTRVWRWRVRSICKVFTLIYTTNVAVLYKSVLLLVEYSTLPN